MKKLEYILKHNIIIQKIYMVVFSFLFEFIGIFIRQDSKQVLLQSMIGKTYGDSPKVLFEAMKKDPRFTGYTYIWAFDDPDKFDVPGAKKIKLTSLQYYIEALRSGIWISNVSIERGLKFKPKRTISIDTWHGIPIKVLGNSQKTRNDYDYSTVDFMCCSSDFERDIFIRDFRIKPETIFQCGMPRNDELYHVTEEQKQNARKELGIPDDKKVILYAPTWRDSIDGGSSYQIAPPMNIDYWQLELGNEYVMLFRLHYMTSKVLGIRFNNFVRDESQEPSINKLMIASDILLYDYSATIFYYSILEKPIISFAYDLEEYAQTRGFYENLEKDVLPGDVFRDEKQVIQHIKNMNYEKECEKSRAVKKKYVATEGNATVACLEFLAKKVAERR